MTAPVDPFLASAQTCPELQLPATGTGCMLAHAGNTAGSLTVMELSIDPQAGPGLHVHSREDEAWYVLEGDFRFHAGDARFESGVGGLAFGPKGVPHAFQNIGEATGRLLVICAPSGIEAFFEEYDAQRPDVIADREDFLAIGHRAGLTFVGPPLAVSDPRTA